MDGDEVRHDEFDNLNKITTKRHAGEVRQHLYKLLSAIGSRFYFVQARPCDWHVLKEADWHCRATGCQLSTMA